MRTVAIVGVGLIGGSFGLALRRSGFRGKILGVSSPATISKAIESGAISEGATLEQACIAADFILLSTPISLIIETLPRALTLARHDAVVTDAGSTKLAIMEAAAACEHARARFVGGHPMAGKESRGVQSADPDLFRGRPWLLCASERDDVVNHLYEVIERVGGIPSLMSASEHDRIVAACSHLPQMVSTALALALSRRPDATAAAAVAGPGLRDMTRLALSDPGIWRDIVTTNREQILSCIDEFTESFAEVREAVENDELERLFEPAAEYAGQLRGNGRSEEK